MIIIQEQIRLYQSQLKRTDESDNEEDEDEDDDNSIDYYNDSGITARRTYDDNLKGNSRLSNEFNATATTTATTTIATAASTASTVAEPNENHHRDCYCYHYCCYYYCRCYQHRDRRKRQRMMMMMTTTTTTKKKQQKISSTVANILVSPLLFLLLLCMQSTAISAARILPLWETQIMPSNTGRNIRHLPCVSRRTGETGLCMFAYSCAKANGTHLGTCIDRFYFGSCCKITPSDVGAEILEPISTNHLSNKEDPFGNDKISPDDSTPHTSSSISISITPNPVSAVSKPVSVINDYSTSTVGQSISSVATHVKTTPVDVATTAGQYPASILYESIPVTTHKPMLNATSSTISTSHYIVSTGSSVSSGIGTYNKPSSSSFTNVSKPPLSTKPTTNKTKPKPPHKPTPTTKPKPTSKPPNNLKPSSTQSIIGSIYSSSTQKYTTPASTSHNGYYNNKTTTSYNQLSSSSSSTVTLSPFTSSYATALHTSTLKPSKPITSSSYTRPSSVSSVVTLSSSASSSTHKLPSSNTEYLFDKTTSPTPSQIFGTRPSSNIPSHSTNQISSGSSSSGTTTGPPSYTNIPGVLISATEAPVIPSDRTKPPVKITLRPNPYENTTNTIDNMTEVSTLSPPSSLSSVVTSTSSGQSNYTTTSRFPSSTMTIPVASPLPIDPSTSVTNDIDTTSVNMSDYRDVCGRRLFPSGRIVGGEKATFGKWPWQISLRQWRTSTYLHKCGAALFNENWAVTAAHCVENVPPSDLLLRLGEHDLSIEEEPFEYQERRVQIVASHPQFDPRTFEYDLALLRFYEPVKFQPNIIPICVPEDDVSFVGSTAYVTGWGRLYEDGPLPSVLQEVSVPVINNSVCEAMYRSAGYIEHIPEIFICAGWRKGGFDSCEGDSGGPMVIQRPDKRWLLAGIISWGIGCAEPNQPGVYTRISEFRDWINQILQF